MTLGAHADYFVVGVGGCEPLVWKLKHDPMSNVGSGTAAHTSYTGSASWARVHCRQGLRRPGCWQGVRGPLGTPALVDPSFPLCLGQLQFQPLHKSARFIVP